MKSQVFWLVRGNCSKNSQHTYLYNRKPQWDEKHQMFVATNIKTDWLYIPESFLGKIKPGECRKVKLVNVPK